MILQFTHPWVLAFVAIPLSLILWEILRKGRRIALPFDHAHAVMARRKWRHLIIPGLILAANILPGLILGTVIILLAGPSRLGPPSEERVLTNIEICFDVSGSMMSPMSFGGSRYTVAKDAVDKFTSRRKGDAFGLTIFGSEVVRWVPLTKDLATIQSATPFLDPAHMPPHMGGTRIGNALNFAEQTLSRQPDGDRLIILVSDGFSSDLDGLRAKEIGDNLAASNIVVHMINVGDGPAPGQMYEVCQPTGGQVFSAQDPQALATIFDHIDHMHPVWIKQTQAEPVDRFRLFAMTGMALLALYGLSLWGLRYTPW